MKCQCKECKNISGNANKSGSEWLYDLILKMNSQYCSQSYCRINEKS